ncbi:N-acetyltransferase [Mucilaginibacter gynuensis]|uniref:N-acetyltransferase n=1 Tax=Mucilaginibacter gynuensis TaxID=1302236 RepID=A0ABP8G066_9SPHI
MIRQATPTDAPHIARLIIQAMGELAAKFINANDPNEAIPVFEHFAGIAGNQYSYENTLVYEDAAGVHGIINGYNGADLEVLRAPFLQHIRSVYGFSVQPENETEAGEFYIDCLSVDPNQQGKGIGKQLIAALVQQHQNLPIGLLVSHDNPLAEKLYTGLGFKVVGQKPLLGGMYKHMQYRHEHQPV